MRVELYGKKNAFERAYGSFIKTFAKDEGKYIMLDRPIKNDDWKEE